MKVSNQYENKFAVPETKLLVWQTVTLRESYCSNSMHFKRELESEYCS